MSNRRGPARVAGLVVVVVVVLATLASPIAAQDEPAPPPDGAPAQQAPRRFPAALVASMTAPDQPELAVRSVYLELQKDKYPNVVVRFAGPFDLPDNGYRLSVMYGDPEGESLRTSLRTVDGAPVGSLDAGVAGAYSEIGPIDAWQNGDGSIRMVLPIDEVPDRGSMWLTVETTDPPASYTSQLYPLDQFLGQTPAGELSASVDAWIEPEGGPRQIVEVPDPPTVTTDGTVVRLTWPEPPPTLIAGAPINTFIDVVRIAPDFTSDGQAPYLVAVDHISGTVNLLDGTQLIPATLDTGGDDWLVTPLDGEVTDRSYIEFDLAAVAEQFGIEVSMQTSALGAARSITLRDGTVVRADGVIGTLKWFTLPARADAPAEAAPPASASADDSDGLPLGLVAGAAVAALAVLVGLVVALRVRRSRRSGEPAEAPDRNEHLLDSAGPLSLGRRLEPGEVAPRPTVDLRTHATGNGSHLDPLFDPSAQDVAPETAIDVPDLELFEQTGIRPVDRPAPPRRRPASQADDLTKALFDAE